MSIAILIMLGILLAGIVVLLAVLCYVILRVLVRWERREEEIRKPPAPMPMDVAEREMKVLDIIDTARNADRELKDVWADQKRAEGWDDEEIAEFLANRPILELN